MVERVVATPAALELIDVLKRKHGTELLFMQSGGCCDNSAANCYLKREFMVAPHDVLLGEVGDVPFYIGGAQYEYWKHTQIILDVVEGGHGGTFSLEGPEGRAFISESRLFSDQEWAELEAAGLV